MYLVSFKLGGVGGTFPDLSAFSFMQQKLVYFFVVCIFLYLAYLINPAQQITFIQLQGEKGPLKEALQRGKTWSPQYFQIPMYEKSEFQVLKTIHI